MKILFAIEMLFLAGSVASAQSTDAQVRPAFHLSVAEEHGHFGTAAWVIVPDTTAEPLRTLVAGGLVIKTRAPRQTAKRIEVLAGGLVGRDGFHPILDERGFTSLFGYDIFQEVLYAVPTNKYMFEEWLTRKFQVHGAKLAVGVKSNVFNAGPLLAPTRQALVGGGPAVMFFPFPKTLVGMEYQFRNQGGGMLRLQLTIAP